MLTLASGAAHAARPPFVGCASDGMGGPIPAPLAPPFPLPRQSRAIAGQLAFYGSAGLSVLAPRNWHCVASYGSGGAFLLVTPQRFTADKVPDFGSLAGPAVELQFLNGMNSGRGDVARVYARLFPAARDFVRQVIGMGFEPATAFPRGPLHTDVTVRRSGSRVAYITPPRHAGMGTFDSRLRPGSEPIYGVATIAAAPAVGVVLLNVRLTRRQHILGAAILAGTRMPSS